MNPTHLQEAGQTTLPESLICGTPIIGSTNGCLPEIIETDNVGFCCKSESDYMKAILNISKVSPKHCKEIAINKYSDIEAAKKFLRILSKYATNGKR